MPKRVLLRALTKEEVDEISRLVVSRRESVRLVQRARVIKMMADDADLTASDAGLRAGFKSNAMGPIWVKRFN